MGWKPQPALLPGAGRQAVSESRNVFPSLHPPQPDSHYSGSQYPLTLHPTPHGSSSSLFLIRATPVSIQVSQPPVISHIQFSTPCSFCSRLLASKSQIPTWILVHDIPISHPVHHRPAPCPLIPIHTLQIVFSLILCHFLAQTK